MKAVLPTIRKDENGKFKKGSFSASYFLEKLQAEDLEKGISPIGFCAI